MFLSLFRSMIWISITCYLFLMNALCPAPVGKPVSALRRICAGVVLALGVCLLAYFVVDTANASTMLEQPICLVVAWGYSVLVLRAKPKVAAYCTVWACLISECAAMVLARVLGMIMSETLWLRYCLKVLFLLLAAAALAWLVRRFLVRQMLHDGSYLMDRRKVLFSGMIVLLFLVLANYQFIFWLLGNDGTTSRNMVMVFRITVGLGAMALLFLQNDIEKRQQAQQELEILNQMWHRQQEQYKLSKENIEIINRKCHDLKHQMAALRTIQDKAEIDRQVAEMENAVMIYDSVIRTGNPVLDVVLTEKSLYCDAHQINMTCLVDGKMLDFIDTVDLYTIFGNALDNAIESVMQQKDKQKRVIQVAAYEEQGMLLIRFRNYCENAPQIVDGLPVTSKGDTNYHGFGLKSIRHTAERYGGGIAIQTGSNFFSLQVLMPLRQPEM